MILLIKSILLLKLKFLINKKNIKIKKIDKNDKPYLYKGNFINQIKTVKNKKINISFLRQKYFFLFLSSFSSLL